MSSSQILIARRSVYNTHHILCYRLFGSDVQSQTKSKQTRSDDNLYQPGTIPSRGRVKTFDKISDKRQRENKALNAELAEVRI